MAVFMFTHRRFPMPARSHLHFVRNKPGKGESQQGFSDAVAVHGECFSGSPSRRRQLSLHLRDVISSGLHFFSAELHAAGVHGGVRLFYREA